MFIDKDMILKGRGGYTVSELKSFLRELNQPLDGNKPELAERLLLFLDRGGIGKVKTPPKNKVTSPKKSFKKSPKMSPKKSPKKINYTITSRVVADNILALTVKENDNFLTFREVLNKWKDDEKFIISFKNEMKNYLSGRDVFWEHPGITNKDLDTLYESVIIFTEDFPKVNESYKFPQLSGCKYGVKSFKNLGGDCKLISPCDDGKDYTNFSRFIKNSSNDLFIKMMKKISTVVSSEIKNNIVYLSTHGHGINWLHVRICKEDKYYHVNFR